MSCRVGILWLLAGVAFAPAAAHEPDASADSSGTIEPPALLAEPVVVYPPDAEAEGMTGDVVMDVEVDARGVVQRIEVVSSPDVRLSWSALGAAAALHLRPARHVLADGVAHPISVRFRYALAFALEPARQNQHPDTHPTEADATEVTGEVHAPGGAPAQGAHVHVDGTAIVATTNADGRFALREVPAGSFVLLAFGTDGSAGRLVVERDGHSHVDVVLDLLSAGPIAQTTVGKRRSGEQAKRTLTQEVAVLDAKQLGRVRGRTLADTLSEVQGVTMVQAGPGIAKPVVRGLFGRRLLLLTDGVRHEGQEWGIDHAPEVDPQLAERIEVVKGAAGVRYGPDAIGGVVLLEPRPMREDVGLDAALSTFGVDNGLRAGAAGRVDVRLPELPQLVLRLEANADRGAAMTAPTYVLGNTASSQLNLGATAEWTQPVFDAVASLKLSYRRHSETRGICYCFKSETPADLAARLDSDTPPGAELWRVDHDIDRPRQEVTHDLLLVRGALDLGATGELTATYALQIDDRQELDQVRRSVQGAQYDFFLMSQTLDLVAVHPRLHFGAVMLSGQLGARGLFQEHTYRGLQLIPNYRRMMGGVFVLERLTVRDVLGTGDFELVAGARADGMLQSAFLSPNAYKTQLRLNPAVDKVCTLGDKSALCESNAPAGSVTLGARQHVAFGKDRGTVQVDLSSATRFPDVDELYLGGRAPSFPVFGLGNASLGPERTMQVSLSGTWSSALVDAEAGVFASRIDNYIAFAPALNDNGTPHVDVLITGAYPRFVYTATTASLMGADASLVALPDAIVSLAGQFAIVRGTDAVTGDNLPFMPPAQTRVEARVTLPSQSAGQPAWIVNSARLVGGFTAVARQEATGAGTDFAPPPPGYALWHARAEAEVRPFDVPLGLSLEVRNLLNERYRSPLSLMRYFADEPGREVWLRVETRFDHSLAR